jgi:hypothetical protein
MFDLTPSSPSIKSHYITFCLGTVREVCITRLHFYLPQWSAQPPGLLRRLTREFVGVLAPGKGNRFILANTAELHARIERLNIRVCELENALRTLQASISKEPHPLLLHTKDVSQDKVPFRPPLTPNLPTHSENSPQLSVESDAEPHSSTVEDDGFVDAFGR